VSERKTVAVIGASNDRRKYGNRAVRAYRASGWDVYPVNPGASTIEGLQTYASILDVPVPVERVTIYLHPEATLEVLDEIARKGVKEVFLNPGSESGEVLRRDEELGLLAILACSIVHNGLRPSRPEG
jgi:predicted CoA-binding protein